MDEEEVKADKERLKKEADNAAYTEFLRVMATYEREAEEQKQVAWRAKMDLYEMERQQEENAAKGVRQESTVRAGLALKRANTVGLAFLAKEKEKHLKTMVNVQKHATMKMNLENAPKGSVSKANRKLSA